MLTNIYQITANGLTTFPSNSAPFPLMSEIFLCCLLRNFWQETGFIVIDRDGI